MKQTQGELGASPHCGTMLRDLHPGERRSCHRFPFPPGEGSCDEKGLCCGCEGMETAAGLVNEAQLSLCLAGSCSCGP